MPTNDHDPFSTPATGVNEDPNDAMRRRQHAALSVLGTIRVELDGQGKRIDEQGRKLDEQGRKLDSMTEVVTQMRVSTGESIGEMKGVLTGLTDELRAKREVTVMHERAVIERDTTRERFQLEDTADDRKAKREARNKIITIIGSILGTGGIAGTIVGLAGGGC